MTKKNILYISHEGSLGGAAKSMLELLKHVSMTANVYVVLPEPGRLEKELSCLNIDYSIVPFELGYGKAGSFSKEQIDNNFIDNYSAAQKVADIAREKNIQLIHTNSSVGNVGAMAAIILGIPHVWHIRELLEEDFGVQFWDKELKTKLFRASQRIITISNTVKEAYYDKYKIVSIVLYDGIDASCYKKVLTNSFDTNELKMIIAGNILPGKGQYDAIKAVKLLAESKTRKIQLFIVGNGSRNYIWNMEKYIYQNQLSTMIKILPFQSDLSNLREQCLISLTCSRMEALGRVTIEAMLAGNIVVGANTGGTLEIVGEREDRGFLYQVGSPKSLAEVIEKVCNLEAYKLSDIQNRAQLYAENTFDSLHYSQDILQLYDEVLQEWRQDLIFNQSLIQKDLEKMNADILLNKLGAKEEEIGSTDQASKTMTQAKKFREMFFILEKWLRLRQKGFSIESLLQQCKIRSIAIYGFGYLGCDLYDELERGVICVKYVIDQNTISEVDAIQIIKPEDEFEQVDAIIITTVMDEEKIKRKLLDKCNFQILTLRELLDMNLN